jgi:hypothetical protein
MIRNTLRAFIPRFTFSRDEIKQLGLSKEHLHKPFLVSLNDHETLTTPSVRETMMHTVKRYLTDNLVTQGEG